MGAAVAALSSAPRIRAAGRCVAEPLRGSSFAPASAVGERGGVTAVASLSFAPWQIDLSGG
jgi:hypothetical protein